jgi:type 1 fimbria pilin
MSFGTSTNMLCTGVNGFADMYTQKYPVVATGIYGVYQTGRANVGIRIYASSQRSDTTGTILLNPARWAYWDSGSSNLISPIAGFRVQLIATGISAGSGVLTLWTPLAERLVSAGSAAATELQLSNTRVAVTSIACSLDSSSINVPLGGIMATQFTGIASTAGDKSFDVGLSCDKSARINVSLAATQNADTIETSVLALSGAGQTGTATGVGVQLLYGDTPLEINNNILLKTSAGGQETLPFTARYYQTQAAVGAGLANSSATLNITYQ